MSKTEIRKEVVVDVVKELLLDVVVTALAFLYWMAMLLLLSLFLMNVWITSIDQIITIAVGLTIVTMVVYLLRRILKFRKDMRQQMQG